MALRYDGASSARLVTLRTFRTPPYPEIRSPRSPRSDRVFHTLESSISHGGIRIRLWPARNELLFGRILTALVARNALRRTRDFPWRMHSWKTLRFRAYLSRGAAHHRGGIPAASRVQPI